jgi:hypothetical protein
MRRGTTPTHTFRIKQTIPNIKKAKVCYSQNEKLVLKKIIDGSLIVGCTITLNLTQEETLGFAANTPVEIELQILTKDGKAPRSDIIKVSCERCLDDEVFA